MTTAFITVDPWKKPTHWSSSGSAACSGCHYNSLISMMMRNIARQAAGEILRDFEASGVDEDLELLRSAWKQPARQAKDVLKCARCAHENDSPLWTRAGERLCTMCGTSLDAGPKTVQPGWRGPLDPEPEQELEKGQRLAVVRHVCICSSRHPCRQSARGINKAVRRTHKPTS